MNRAKGFIGGVGLFVSACGVRIKTEARRLGNGLLRDAAATVRNRTDSFVASWVLGGCLPTAWFLALDVFPEIPVWRNSFPSGREWIWLGQGRVWVSPRV